MKYQKFWIHRLTAAGRSIIESAFANRQPDAGPAAHKGNLGDFLALQALFRFVCKNTHLMNSILLDRKFPKVTYLSGNQITFRSRNLSATLLQFVLQNNTFDELNPVGQKFMKISFFLEMRQNKALERKGLLFSVKAQNAFRASIYDS